MQKCGNAQGLLFFLVLVFVKKLYHLEDAVLTAALHRECSRHVSSFSFLNNFEQKTNMPFSVPYLRNLCETYTIIQNSFAQFAIDTARDIFCPYYCNLLMVMLSVVTGERDERSTVITSWRKGNVHSLFVSYFFYSFSSTLRYFQRLRG